MATNAGVSAAAIGGSFGVAFATINVARARVPAAAGVAPLVLVAAGAGSAYVERSIRTRAAVPATPLPASHIYDAVAPIVFGSVNAAYTLSSLPKFPPASRAGVAATLVTSAVSTFVAGGVVETLAQGLKPGDEPEPEPPSPDKTRAVAIGRAACMLPSAAYARHVSNVLRQGPLDPRAAQTIGLRNTGVLAASWAVRGVLAAAADAAIATMAEVRADAPTAHREPLGVPRPAAKPAEDGSGEDVRHRERLLMIMLRP